MYSVLLFSLGHFLNDFYCNFLPVLLPLIMPRMGLSLTLSGLLIMVMSITSNVLQPIFGYWMDRKNMSCLLIPAIPFGAICICSIGYLENTYLLFLLIAMTGLSVSSFHPLGSSLASKTAPAGKLGLSMSFYVAGGNIGFACAPLAIVAFTQKYTLEYLPILIVPSLLLAAVYHFTGLSKTTTLSQQSLKKSSFSITPQAFLANLSIIKLNISMGFRAWTHTAVSTFLPLLLIQQGYSAMDAGYFLTIFLVGAALGGLAGGYAGDHLGHKRIILFTLLAGLLPTYYFFTHMVMNLLSLTALFLSGASLQAPQPSSLVWAQKLLPDHAGMASGMMMGLSFGLGSIGTAITAACADHIGLLTALLWTTLPMLISVIVTLYTKFPSQKQQYIAKSNIK